MTLAQYEAGNWSTEEFVGLANRVLPEVLPEENETELNLRLVRHYTSLGMLDDPSKVGKEARYTYRHLLQLLLVRRLLAQGYGSAAITDFPRKHDNSKLTQLLSGQLELTVQSNPALDFLEGVRQRTGQRAIAEQTATQTRWTRITPLPGLEINISDSFQCPSLPLLDQALESVRRVLTQKSSRR